MHYVVVNDKGDYWCNENGWTEFREWAAAYDSMNSSLPMGGRWREIPNWLAYQIAMGKLRDDADGGDMWGWAMSWIFDMCGFLMLEREVSPPDELQYRPGALGPETVDDEWKLSILRDMADTQIVHCLKVLHRYARLLEKHGGELLMDFADTVRAGLMNVKVKTHNNDHLGARLFLARLLKHEQAEKVFGGLQQIHHVECEMHEDMLSIERRWTNLMLRWVEIHHPRLTADIRRSL